MLLKPVLLNKTIFAFILGLFYIIFLQNSLKMEIGKKFLFTSESVGEGHPDKLCDRISDAILDAHLKIDPLSKVAVETIVNGHTVFICGEITSHGKVDYKSIVRRVLKDSGYDRDDLGLDYKTVDIQIYLKNQSLDISQSVGYKGGIETNAGDQGIMFGYATNETSELMPASIMWAHRLVKKLKELRATVKFLGPDCKSQVTVEYIQRNGVIVPQRIHTIVISTQHTNDISTEDLRSYLIEYLIKSCFPEKLLQNTLYYIQSSGRFVIGGPEADAGLTGRKIIVDSYGGFGCHGGGCFSGKDWTKVDRSGAYAARWIAKSLVHAGICKRVLIQLSYAIGVASPLSIFVDTYGTSEIDDSEIVNIIEHNFDLRPGAIAKDLKLDQPIFEQTATFGHFGRNEFPWEIPKQLITNFNTYPDSK